MTPTLLNNRYRVVQALGAGGFGDTFLAEDTHMPSGRRCVIKQLKPLTSNPQIYQLVQERFQREAAILEELGEGSTQIPKLYAYFASEGQFYLIQEYIEGQTLSQTVLMTGSWNESAVREMLVSLLPVLDYVHAHRMVHRDIKPDNIILRQRDGKPVLIDFGAVKETMGTVVNSEGNSASSLVIGTPGFMPSEQAAGRPMYSSDLYSLGLTAIYVLTGKRPQELEIDPNTGEIIWQQYAVGVNPSLVAVLDKAIQSHPRDRFPSAHAMLEALQSHAVPIAATVPFSRPEIPTVNITNPLPKAPGNSLETLQFSQQESSPRKTINPVIIGSLIIGSLVGVSVVVGFALMGNRQPTSVVPLAQQIATPKPVDSSPSNTSKNEVTKPSPEAVIRDYYSNINKQIYQTAWRMQSPRLQSNQNINPKGYPDYLKFWNTVQKVDIQEINLINESSEMATVDVRLKYIDKNGQVASSYPNQWRYFLIWDAAENSWLLDNREQIDGNI